MTIEFINANIINARTAAIVLPANPDLKEGKGASAAIFKAAGRKKLKEVCRQLEHCDVGNAVPTKAYDLNADFIIHTVVPKWRDGKHNEYELLSSAYLSALNVADQLECETIAFPLLAAGHNGFDTELAFEIAEESIKAFNPENLKKAVVVLYGERANAIAKKKNYSVEVPMWFATDEEKVSEKEERLQQLTADGKKMAKKIATEQMKTAIEWGKKAENREKIINIGVDIAASVLKKKINPVTE